MRATHELPGLPSAIRISGLVKDSWDWALGGDPLTNPSETWRYLALAGTTAALLVIGVVALLETGRQVGVRGERVVRSPRAAAGTA